MVPQVPNVGGSDEPCGDAYESPDSGSYGLVRLIVFGKFLRTLGIVNSQSPAVNPVVSEIAGSSDHPCQCCAVKSGLTDISVSFKTFPMLP